MCVYIKCSFLAWTAKKTRHMWAHFCLSIPIPFPPIAFSPAAQFPQTLKVSFNGHWTPTGLGDSRSCVEEGAAATAPLAGELKQPMIPCGSLLVKEKVTGHSMSCLSPHGLLGGCWGTGAVARKGGWELMLLQHASRKPGFSSCAVCRTTWRD